MAIRLLVFGDTKEKFFKQSEEEYLKRLNKFCKFQYIQLPSSKNSQKRDECLKAEEEHLFKKITPSDYVILLDEAGEHWNSRKFSTQLNKILISKPNMLFIIGGAFGFSDKVKARSNGLWSLSKLTFPHHLVRTIFLEQLYRSFTILNGGNYHND